MTIKSQIRVVAIIFLSTFAFGCSHLPTSSKSKEPSAKKHDMTFGNADNVQIVQNPTMMFHDITVSQTTKGVKLEGKIHARTHLDYVPGHIDIVVVDKKTGEIKTAITTDFNNHIARRGRYNLLHPNNISTRLPGVNPEDSNVVLAYHYSNVDRFSKVDCGANAAVASLQEMKKDNDSQPGTKPN